MAVPSRKNSGYTATGTGRPAVRSSSGKSNWRVVHGRTVLRITTTRGDRWRWIACPMSPRQLLLPDVAGHSAQVRKVEAAVSFAGRANADKGKIGITDRRVAVGGGAQAAGAHTFLNELAEPRLDHWRVALVQQIGLDWVRVDTDHGVAIGCQAGGRDRADVAEAKHADPHDVLPRSSCRTVTKT
jgi:hypothetical protein